MFKPEIVGGWPVERYVAKPLVSANQSGRFSCPQEPQSPKRAGRLVAHKLEMKVRAVWLHPTPTGADG
ncbi:hypothetical protein IC229_29035 [Spirosoma sp. BT702]|uniref:Uncharacterized protein n=1 Tax=Spirosoma profusum TaxID=2771354 RepID=A0A927AUM5_9BACT|nr:hypothetical protein [Spirosoma profusum]MBD2704715.1 hypothetical protein [Spirosoma profusum]